jgi:N-acetylmuramic acid 6-phosphate etherase
MDQLQTEARNPASTNLDELTSLQLVRLMNAEDARVVPAVAARAEALARAIDLIADRLREGGRLIYVGAGTSGRLGVLDATECPPTFNAPPGQVVGIIAGGPAALTRAVEGAEDHPEFAERDLEALGLTARDVVVGIATSGRTPYVLGAVAHAKRRGAPTIGVSCNPDSELSKAADLAITPVVGPEILSGSTRLKAGTATKLVLNVLSTGAMVRLGKTYGNLMVDLRATNSKLRARTNRIVRILTGLSVEAADSLLRRCDGELKTALVAHLAGVEPEEARSRLGVAGGRVRDALGIAKPEEPSKSTSPAGELVLGIDGGGTHTVALLAARQTSASSAPLTLPSPPEGGEGRVRGAGWSVLGRGEAGPSNRHAVGDARAFAALDEAVTAAFAAAGLCRAPVGEVCLGLAGAGRAEDQEAVRRWALQVNLAPKVQVTSDAALLLAAGTPEGWGLALVAGTGSIAYAQTADGRTARSGGWGYLLGDEGSAYALVMAALRAVARAADGCGPATRLMERFLARFGLDQPHELIPTIYRGSWDRKALAALAPLVIEAVAEDAVAARIVDEAARDLAQTAAAAARSLGLGERPLPLALAGGLLLASAGYRERVLQALKSLNVYPDPVTLVSEPAVGAIRLTLARGDREGRQP